MLLVIGMPFSQTTSSFCSAVTGASVAPAVAGVSLASAWAVTIPAVIRDAVFLLYVGKHEEAYEWAKKHYTKVNSTTGGIQTIIALTPNLIREDGKIKTNQLRNEVKYLWATGGRIIVEAIIGIQKMVHIG